MRSLEFKKFFWSPLSSSLLADSTNTKEKPPHLLSHCNSHTIASEAANPIPHNKHNWVIPVQCYYGTAIAIGLHFYSFLSHISIYVSSCFYMEGLLNFIEYLYSGYLPCRSVSCRFVRSFCFLRVAMAACMRRSFFQYNSIEDEMMMPPQTLSHTHTHMHRLQIPNEKNNKLLSLTRRCIIISCSLTYIFPFVLFFFQASVSM